MGIVKVNRTGKSYKVYLTNATNPNEVIGTIYNNEVFTWTGGWAGSNTVQGICFRNSAGKVAYGWVIGYDTEAQFATNLHQMAAKTVVQNGKTYYAFKMRRDEELYDGGGNGISKKALKDRYILSEGSSSGASHADWLAVRYLETGVGTGKYDPIMDGVAVAFVDMGFDKGSTMGKDFSLIGSI